MGVSEGHRQVMHMADNPEQAQVCVAQALRVRIQENIAVSSVTLIKVGGIHLTQDLEHLRQAPNRSRHD